MTESEDDAIRAVELLKLVKILGFLLIPIVSLFSPNIVARIMIIIGTVKGIMKLLKAQKTPDHTPEGK